MSASSKFWISIVANPAMQGTYHASFKVPGGPPPLGLGQGGRKVFTDRGEAELDASRLMVAHLNENSACAGLTEAKKGTLIKGYRAEGVGKGSGRPVKNRVSEADAVFVNFKGRA